MTNISILAAFERMWVHVVDRLNKKADINHSHDDVYYTEGEVDTLLDSTKSYIDSAIAEGASNMLLVSTHFAEDGTLVSNYSSSEIIEHLKNGGCTRLQDIDAGEMAFLWNIGGSVLYGTVFTQNGVIMVCSVIINGNTADIFTTELNPADYAKLTDVYSKAETDEAFVSVSETYETKSDANAKLTEAKQYTDDLGSGFVNALLLMYGDDAPEGNDVITIRDIAKDEVSSALPISGGTMTGKLTLAADPANAMEAATKQYVDNLIGTILNGAS